MAIIDVVKYNGNDEVFAWKFPSEDLRLGTQLVVKTSQAAVFVKPEFVSWANEKVILLELDFPRRTALPDSLKQQNQQLAGVFQVKGYPTCWLFETTKNEETNQINIVAFGSLGYPSGATKGKEEVKFIETANEILANKKL